MSIDAFLSHSHENAVWVEALACRLEDEFGIKVWLDKWVLVPGKSWQPAMARGLEEAASCAVFIGADAASVSGFLSLRTWADFRDGQDHAYALHVLRQGIKGMPVGRWPVKHSSDTGGKLRQYEQRIIELARFRSLGVHEEVIIEFERKILDSWLDTEGTD
jgi:hypothetical protein